MDMRPVNLASARVAERQYCKRILLTRFRILVALMVVDLVFVGLGGFLTDRVAARRNSLNAKIAAIQGNSLRVRKELAVVRDQRRLSAWSSKLSGESHVWIEAIEGLARCLPEDSWLSRVQTDPSNGRIAIQGGALDLETVARLALAMTSLKDFQDLKLGSSQLLTVNGRDAVSFSMSARIADAPSTTPPPSQQAGAPASEGTRT